MAHDPALPKLSPEEQDELERRRRRHTELLMINSPEEAAKVRNEFQQNRARIWELIEKGQD